MEILKRFGKRFGARQKKGPKIKTLAGAKTKTQKIIGGSSGRYLLFGKSNFNGIDGTFYITVIGFPITY